ncbi:hypothetical protein HYC85_025186 [Camellia sinensis]|uniref:Uncharacterized protein n=1 Tax=Camellia sinensis TaxID=4442 RepID=A0A7J7GA99_CAMSI|nr:hypothetical protein HYC85_025186 [Camellia sinensis]
MSSPQVLLKNPFLCICLFLAQITKPSFLNSLISMSPAVRPTRHSIICEAAPNKKADSAAKRARQAEKRRVYNKARKSEVNTRMKKSKVAFDYVEFYRFPPSGIMQPGGHYLQQHQQAQQMTPQSLMAARSSMLYSQQQFSALQQRQALHSQLGMSSGGSSGLHMLQSEANSSGTTGGALGAGGFPDFGRGSTGEGLQASGRGKQEIGSSEGRGGGSSGGHGGEGGESLYLKASEDVHLHLFRSSARAVVFTLERDPLFLFLRSSGEFDARAGASACKTSGSVQSTLELCFYWAVAHPLWEHHFQVQGVTTWYQSVPGSNTLGRGRGRGRRGRPGRQEVPVPEEIPAVQEGIGQANVAEPVGQQAMGALA